MIKRSAIKRICVATLTLFVLLIIYLFPSKDIKVDKHLTYLKQAETPIFLIDRNNYVARSTIIKSSDSTIELVKEIIETLTINSNKSAYIKDGFKGIIPENTKLIDLYLEDSILTLNFDDNLLKIDNENKDKLYEALTYSLLEISEIKKIKILIDSVPLQEIDKSTPEYFDKSYGINKIYNLTSLKDTTKTTIYYLSKYNEDYYYVPVTMVSNSVNERVEIIIKELKSTPIYQTNLISYLKASANMTSYEILEDQVNLSFNNYLIANISNEDILESVKYQLALSIRDTYGIKEVNFSFPDQGNGYTSAFDKIIFE